MTLLNQYVNAVRMYLPKGPQQEDILSELSEHLQSRIDEEEEALGRPLTEVEQEAMLTRHGNPALVAERYGAPRRSVAFGWQLIGPELFPLYARILLLNWSVTIVAVPIIGGSAHQCLASGSGRLPDRCSSQSVFVTLPYMRRFFSVGRVDGRPRARRQRNWRFPPTYLQPIPRWQSLVGLIMFGAVTIWWTLVPVAPALMLGSAATSVEFPRRQPHFYWRSSCCFSSAPLSGRRHSRVRTGTGCRPSLVSSLTVRRSCCSIHLR